MGSTDFTISARGKNIHEAYNKARQEAIDECGNDAYNGTISTTICFCLGYNGVSDKTNSFKNSRLSKDEFINKYLGDCRKWGNVFGFCVEEPVSNTLKVKSQVEHKVTKGTKKWILKYVVNSMEGNQIAVKNTKGEAIKMGREYTEKNMVRTFITMEKVLESGSKIVANITYKKSDKEKEGKYVFFGISAE